MPATLTSAQVWKAVEKEIFAVLGMVSEKQEARTVGIVYVVHDRKLYIGTDKSAWKTRHLARNPHVSITIPIEKHIPLMPWYKIPAATITFSGTARLLSLEEAPAGLMDSILKDMIVDPTAKEETCMIEVTPEKEFLTYGVGVSLMEMRDPVKATGRAPVA